MSSSEIPIPLELGLGLFGAALLVYHLHVWRTGSLTYRGSKDGTQHLGGSAGRRLGQYLTADRLRDALESGKPFEIHAVDHPELFRYFVVRGVLWGVGLVVAAVVIFAVRLALGI